MKDAQNKITEIDKDAATQALASIQSTQQETIEHSRPPMWISAITGLSYGAIVAGYGLMRHENQWALMMIVGGVVFALSVAIYLYRCYLLGVKPAILPRSNASKKLNIYSALFFAVMVVVSRELTLFTELNFIPWVCGLLCGGVLVWLQRMYPTGEVVNVERPNE
ncbi:hypothetical protein [Pseudoalteromonas luteoviolacea]|uniref:Uncharacterized protein n=1 Tax=Pseudoalteromonas luteoviolacea S4054 TaxID=1129367 RepID=A0A0F6A4V8_9GAMM|nr:hypothetical protein [Pseudoalteromonas luteoviolacea]AOT07671.1 hypothetical protein S4054249_07355 [Pseudoalteromonas luteoviolacea]AOT12587.1 hypothetical protein S40542_07355 [Pseudoalteromonas luteoviolacea]AOT17501.1 hypothetical protein S4054_07355 [Pseudoalteromonas luteoviolacea]KKE81207.1 hypothetical protein N479_23280 [Pseudoalteromonas luteoviolacea S4054]KZN66335.1 hypothetical protein N481_24375 [Pseudoalteromonas luteoviolacea S4047-1]